MINRQHTALEEIAQCAASVSETAGKTFEDRVGKRAQCLTILKLQSSLAWKQTIGGALVSMWLLFSKTRVETGASLWYHWELIRPLREISVALMRLGWLLWRQLIIKQGCPHIFSLPVMPTCPLYFCPSETRCVGDSVLLINWLHLALYSKNPSHPHKRMRKRETSARL